MRWSVLFTPTLRDAPGDAEAASHKLLIRGGFMRQLHSGHYTLLPLGYKVKKKLTRLVQEEMDAVDGQEVQMPTMHPAKIWKDSGRWESMGDIMFRLEDRGGAPTALGVTAEEIFAIIGKEITSYKQLPQTWYQIHTKFRDEPRPKSGLLRVREFTMKDAYTFDMDEAGLDLSFDRQAEAYRRVFERLDLQAIPVEASSGNMGGSDSIEFMVPAEIGEDLVVICPTGDYAANIEKATSALPEVTDDAGLDAPERFDTPGIRTIAALAEAEATATPENQIKTMVYVIDDVLTLALVRGDHQLNEQKLADITGASTLRPAGAEEVFKALGAHPGSLGAVGVTDHTIIVDPALKGRRAMTTGANTDDVHFRGVDVERDIAVGQWAELREVKAGEPCPSCGTALEITPTIEVGHIFKLGTKFSKAFGANVLNSDGKQVPLVMGSYGIGIDRNIAVVVETHHDDNGIIWPVSIAPFEAVVTILRLDDDVIAAAEALYDDLKAQGIDVLLDDRDARAGVKFADAELIGIPWRLTVGPRGLKNGEIELTERATGETTNVPTADVVAHVAAAITAAR